jgi:endoglucanase
MTQPKRYQNSSIRFALCFLAELLLLSSSSLASASAFIRYNQVGYETNATKRAYLMASATESGATFTVKNLSGTTVLGPVAIGANLGSWSSSYPDVYALDFDSVTTAGTYTISVSGPQAASATVKVDTGANLFSAMLANTLTFYEDERDGPSIINTSLRNSSCTGTCTTAAGPGHVNDQSATVYLTPNMNSNGHFSGSLTPVSPATVIDASGGWWDAGDYMKFVETHSYTVAEMLIGVRDFPSQMGSGSTPSNFTNEAKFGLDWLQKMWNDSNRTLYYQVAIGNGNAQTTSDHDIWRLPQADDTYGGCTSQFRYICHRPVFINTAGGSGAMISPNLAGRLTAAFAECYIVFQTSNASYANQCLVSAEHVFNLANTNPSSLLTVAPNSFYPETEWRDDLELGATELYFALQKCGSTCNVSGLDTTKTASYYLQQGTYWANAYITGPNDAADTLNLYDVSGLAHYELYRAITLDAGHTTGLSTTQAALLADLKKQLDKAVTQSSTDPFGFGFTWAAFDTTSHGEGLIVMANEYGNLVAPNANPYAAYADRWLANILGTNGWGTSLIVNDGTTFPLCMQHQVANLVPKPPNGPPFLSGAAVEGPNTFAATGLVTNMQTCPPNGVDQFAQFNSGKTSNGKSAVYQDNVQSWSTVEPAIDLTALSFLAFSWEIAGAPSGTP